MNNEIPTIELHVRKAELFKALGHPIRVRVLELLQGNELSVSMMLAAIAVEPSTLSTHLAVLRRADVVATSRKAPRSSIGLPIRPWRSSSPRRANF